MMATGWTRGLLVLGFGGVLMAGSVLAQLLSQDARAETQQTGTPLSNPTTSPGQADQATKITPEQEVALVEVRKILREAKQAAERFNPEAVVVEWVARGITSPILKSTVLKDVQSSKSTLLGEVERAQFRAGDFATAPTTKQYWDLALGQIRYGYLSEAVQTATGQRFSFTPEILVIMKMLADAGDLAGAREVVQGSAAKEPIEVKRRQAQAELLAYLARRQALAGKPEASATLDRAIEAVKANNKYQTFQYAGWTAIGCAHAVMGDKTASAEAFRQAIQAVKAMLREEHKGHKASALSVVGRAAGMSGVTMVSQEAFRESLRLADEITESRAHVVAIANIAVMQILGGDRGGGLQTFQGALKFTEGLSSNQERRTALGDVVERQLTAGEREAATATLKQMRQRADALADSKERDADYETVKWWDAKLVTPQLALDQAYALKDDDEKQAGALAYAAYWLVHGQKSVIAPDALKRMSQTALTLLAKPLPDERKKAELYLSNLARVQVVADGASQALQTAGRIADHNHRKSAYIGLMSLLVKKRDVMGAEQVVKVLKAKEEDLLWGSSGATLGDTLRELGKVRAEGGDVSEAMTWARQQQSHYAEAEALLGVALGVMEQQGVYDLGHDLLTIKTVGTGRLDKLAILCASF